MKLSPQRKKDKQARDRIFDALKEYHGCDPDIPEFTELRIPHEKYHLELTARGLQTGLMLLGLINNMSGLSAGDIDLYRLIEKYLLDKNAREKINEVIW